MSFRDRPPLFRDEIVRFGTNPPVSGTNPLSSGRHLPPKKVRFRDHPEGTPECPNCFPSVRVCLRDGAKYDSLSQIWREVGASQVWGWLARAKSAVFS